MRIRYLLTLWVLSALALSLQSLVGSREGMLTISILLIIPFVLMAGEDIQQRQMQPRRRSF